MPLVVAIHGMGDTPEHFARVFDGFPVAARFVFPRAPSPYGGGFSWFHYPPTSQDELASGVAAAADQVAALLVDLRRTRPTTGAPIVTGFSQGGFLSFAVAVRHPDVVAAAFPVSGSLPTALWPAALPDAAPPPIFALHGDADPVVKIEPTRAAVAHLRAIGWPVELHQHAGVGHTIDAATRTELTRRLVAQTRLR